MPAAAPGGAFVAFGGTNLMLATYQDTSQTWAPSNAVTGVTPIPNLIPAVVTTSSGDPLVLFTSSGDQSYAYTLRTAGTWSTAAAIPTSKPPPSAPPQPAIIAVRRTGSDAIVAAMFGSALGELDTAVYSGGTWTTTTNVVTDAAFTPERSFALAALPDGRVALAYVDGSNSHAGRLAFFDGSWGQFASVPGSGGVGEFPIAIARGANGEAIVEFVYIDGSGALQHIRLTDEASWTWTSPVAVAPGSFRAAYIAVGP
jgi:hypothetical protein